MSALPSRARKVSAVARRSMCSSTSCSLPSSLTSNSTLPRRLVTTGGRSQIRTTGVVSPVSADLSGLLALFEGGDTVETGELVPASDLLSRVGEVIGLAKIMQRLGMEGSESLGHAAAAVEFALEGLYLMRRLSKDVLDGGALYRT